MLEEDCMLIKCIRFVVCLCFTLVTGAIVTRGGASSGKQGCWSMFSGRKLGGRVEMLHSRRNLWPLTSKVRESWGSWRRRRPQAFTFHLIQVLPVFVVLCQMLHQTWQTGKGIPGIKHVCDEIVNKWDLGFRNAAGIPVKHWHDNRQTLSLLLVSLSKVLLWNATSPFDAELQRSAGIGHVGTFNQHPFN